MFALCAFLSLVFVIESSAQSSASPSHACSILNNSSATAIFYANQAYNCLQSVPFNSAVASRFIKYFEDRLQFQTTIEYLKNPPSTYKQPASDLRAGLAQIQRRVDENDFQSQYEFESALQTLIYSAHDGHLYLNAGALSVFSFQSPISITALSVDGIQPPKVYSNDDLDNRNGSGLPPAVKTINGQDPVEWLKALAAQNAIGNLEPHADWNQLMSSPVSAVLQTYSVFENDVTFYPGKTLEMTKDDGSVEGPYDWLAYYNARGPTGPLATGGDFYNFFVLGLFPGGISYPSNSGNSSQRRRLTRREFPSVLNPNDPPDADPVVGWLNEAYPVPDVIQKDLGLGGYVTGYFLNRTRRAVLSIPSFSSDPDDAVSFTETITSFLTKSKAAGMKQVVIDLQGNRGGTTLLAIDTFKQFFPSIEPYTGTRMRSHPTADTLGKIYTEYFNTNPPNNKINQYYYQLVTSEWVASDRLNNAGDNFTNWDELYGPRAIHGDEFTNTEHFNLSSFVFDVLYSGGIDIYGYPGREATSLDSPYASKDIIILTDGLCASDCAIFLDLMVQQGVRTVVAGGLPEDGPMQAAAGTRGAEEYGFGEIDDDIDLASTFDEKASDGLPNIDEAIWVAQGSVNLRDQLRPGDDEPLQFKFMPATCRIYFTVDTYDNYPKLWNRAADAIWSNSSLCVPGSTGHPYYLPNNSSSSASSPTRRAVAQPAAPPRINAERPKLSLHLIEDPEVQVQTLSRRGELVGAVGTVCPKNEVGRREKKPNFQCLGGIPLCSKFGKLDYNPEPRIVQTSYFHYKTNDPKGPKEPISPRPAPGCTNDNGKCIPIADQKPYRLNPHGKSPVAGQWVVRCYCKLRAQVCNTEWQKKLFLDGHGHAGALSDGEDDRTDVSRVDLLGSGSVGDAVVAGMESWR